MKKLCLAAFAISFSCATSVFSMVKYKATDVKVTRLHDVPSLEQFREPIKMFLKNGDRNAFLDSLAKIDDQKKDKGDVFLALMGIMVNAETADDLVDRLNKLLWF